ncbi:MAG: RecX family transcriptional regulator [Oscillospiraceae bacterium]|nr:RecX family transcriptional regulator [Oscillospiraceae bacterium]
MGYWDEYLKNDKVKQKLLRYIMFKKRTEAEVRIKLEFIIEKFNFSDLGDKDNFIDNLIENLKEQGYINDEKYIEKSFLEFMKLKTLSIKEIKIKLLMKGLDKELIEQYINSNNETLKEYELNSAKKIMQKKSTNLEPIKIKQYLIKRGYSEESYKNV